MENATDFQPSAAWHSSARANSGKININYELAPSGWLWLVPLALQPLLLTALSYSFTDTSELTSSFITFSYQQIQGSWSNLMCKSVMNMDPQTIISCQWDVFTNLWYLLILGFSPRKSDFEGRNNCSNISSTRNHMFGCCCFFFIVNLIFCYRLMYQLLLTYSFNWPHSFI